MEETTDGDSKITQAASRAARERLAELEIRPPVVRAKSDLNGRIDDLLFGNSSSASARIVKRVLRRHAAQARADGDDAK